jgi:pimeloyl-ACP methyl ester carboxylesterase
MRADQAAEIMSRIAQRPATLGNRYDVASPQSLSFADLCERIGMVYGLSLLSVDDRQSLNVIDRLFHERLNGFHAHFMLPGKIACEETYRAAGFSPEDVLLDEEAQVALFEAILCNQNSVRDARRERVADLPGSLEQKTINRGDFQLTYYSGGTGEIPIILLNALGQGMHYWYRLIDNLMQRHRVIIWEPRGTVSPPPPFGIKDQVDDLEAVLENEAADTCYLIGWCTGPKVATEFYLRRPSAVPAMVFLNSTFRCLGGPEEYETDYEHNLEPLCRLLNRRPETAASVMKSLQASISGDNINLLEESDPEQLAAGVLSLINVDLKQEVLMPFRNESTTLNYSQQVLDFWSHNTLEDAPRVQIPVLVIGSEYDKSASPEMSRLAAELFPTARYVQLQGATHYCFYDRPDLITELIERFFHDPDALSGIDGEAKLIRHDNEVVCQSEGDLTNNWMTNSN